MNFTFGSVFLLLAAYTIYMLVRTLKTGVDFEEDNTASGTIETPCPFTIGRGS